MQFQVEVRPRSSADRTVVAYYQIDAVAKEAAIAEAMRRFSEQEPDKALTDYQFKAAKS